MEVGKSGHSCVVTIDLVQNAGTFVFILKVKCRYIWKPILDTVYFWGGKNRSISFNVKFKKDKRLHLTV